MTLHPWGVRQHLERFLSAIATTEGGVRRRGGWVQAGVRLSPLTGTGDPPSPRGASAKVEGPWAPGHRLCPQ